MKQLSAFVIFIVCLNAIDQISGNRYREYEAPRIIHTSSPQEQVQKQNSKDLELLNEVDNQFSSEKILKWIEEVSKKDIKQMKKEEIHHNLEGIKRASSQIQNYLKRVSSQIEASINTIDLKVNEINIVDEKISKLKPAYKEELDKISKESGSLLNALGKEKTAVDEVLKKLRKENENSSNLGNKSDDVEKKIELLDLSKTVKEKINEKLVSFMSLKNFEKVHKKFMTVVEKEMEKNFAAYKKYPEDKIAADLIVKNWSDLLKQAEKEEVVVVESINTKPNVVEAKNEKEEVKITDRVESSIAKKINSLEENVKSEESVKKEKEQVSKQTSNPKEDEKQEDNEDSDSEEEENEVDEAAEKIVEEKKDTKKGSLKKANKSSKSNRKSITETLDKEDSEDDEEEDEEEVDSESEFDQEYFTKSPEEDRPTSFLEKPIN